MSGPRWRIDRVVYMALNTVTERAYVGSSKYGLARRRQAHRGDALKKRQLNRFLRALLEWDDCCWEWVVLERCSTEGELDAAERRWIAECGTLDAGVGYNTYDSTYPQDDRRLTRGATTPPADRRRTGGASRQRAIGCRRSFGQQPTEGAQGLSVRLDDGR